jgi:hypothetical protein
MSCWVAELQGCRVNGLPGCRVAGLPRNGAQRGLFESFATALNRESFSPRGFLRGEKVAKPAEGGDPRNCWSTPCRFAPSSACRHLLPRKKPRGRRALDGTECRPLHSEAVIHCTLRKHRQECLCHIDPATPQRRARTRTDVAQTLSVLMPQRNNPATEQLHDRQPGNLATRQLSNHTP